MNLNNKTFQTKANKLGLSSSDTVFHYRQKGDLITATYKGGEIKEGSILGRLIHTDITLLYHCITDQGVLLAGEANGKVIINKQGFIEILLDWKWLNGDQSGGKSHYIEMGS